jgi:thiol:disulfide interchange protein DsbD
MRNRLSAFLCGLIFAGGLAAAPVRNGAVEAELVSSVVSIQPGAPFTVALRMRHDSYWHTYWLNAGTGYPTSLEWKLPDGFKAGPIQWPVPLILRDAAGKTTGYGYERENFLLVKITPPAGLVPGSTVTLQAHAEWLMCQESCMPGSADLTLTLPVKIGVPRRDGQWAEKIADFTGRLPVDLPPGWSVAVRRQGAEVELHLKVESGVRPAADSLYFLSADGLIDYERPQEVRSGPDGYVFKLKVAESSDPKTTRLVGVIRADDGWGPRGEVVGLNVHPGIKVNVPFNAAVPAGGSGTGTGFLATLGLAFLGGLILNLMPCVFPVLGIKVLGFVNQSGHDRRVVTLHGLVFSAGVLASFWVLAGALAGLRAGGSQLGWGFQLQSPGFVFALSGVMLTFALSLSGVFEFGLRATGVGAELQMREGYAGSFFTGVLATVVATPCSAPFLAPALGAALALPTAQAFIVFTSIAVGLALPYLLLSIFPSAVKMLPRPGPWMETFKQLMAFPLYATVGYLLWVLAGQTPENGLLMAFFGLTLVAMAAWLYGRFGLWSRRKALASFVLLLWGGWLGWPQTASPSEITWKPWSPEAVAQATAEGKTVYVDFTARWCATCQTNKKLVFASDEVKRAFRAQGIVLLKADWTNQDARITAELAKWGRSAVPFNLVIKPGQPPQPLPELLTPGLVLEALQAP